ncbi:SH3 domain-containing protein [Peribacillus glennii]|uniref:Peptide-binding protein n=1 Tax=Peribacillus glennii TaxID=2303991 RepID=A0A372LDZ3_9BACI|nr:SH3 domain-containing protein [Peribacillus glennii]RFU63973.1 peptide-binding protein [Peribacillus glennii]
MKKACKALFLSTALLLGPAIAPVNSLDLGMTEASELVKFSKTTYLATSDLAVRSGAGTKFKTVIKVPKGKTVTSTERSGDWYKVSYVYTYKGKSATKTGWVKGGLKEYYRYITTQGIYYITKKQSSLYSSPDMKKKAVYTVAADNGFHSTQKVINSIGHTWYRVSYHGKTLYVKGSYVSQSPIKNFTRTTFIAKKDAYVYRSHGNAYTKLMKIPQGVSVTSERSVGNWYKVTYRGKTGYFYLGDFTKYTKPVEYANSGKTYLINADLNVRKLANWSSGGTVVVPKGKIIVPSHKTSNGWYKVSYSKKTGYVPASHLQQVTTGDPLSSRTGYQFVDLRKPASVSAKQINDYIASYVAATKKPSVLTNKGQAFIDAGKKYGVNSVYLAAHAIHESAFGTSQISLGKKNLFGFGAYDASPYIAAVRFSSVEQNIEYIAREMKATYLNPQNWKYKGAYLGYSTKTMKNARVNENSTGMNYFYASDPMWGRKIADHMAKIVRYSSSHYSKAKINANGVSMPTRPQGTDKFPENIEAIAKKDLAIYKEKGKEPVNKPIDKGTKFLLLEKTNDFWVKIRVDEEIYWTNTIKFDVYNQFISVSNLGRSTGNPLNVRKEPNTSSAIIGSGIKLNSFVELVLKKDGTPKMDNTKKWYELRLDDKTTGWVSAHYIVRELK